MYLLDGALLFSAIITRSSIDSPNEAIAFAFIALVFSLVAFALITLADWILSAIIGATGGKDGRQ